MQTTENAFQNLRGFVNSSNQKVQMRIMAKLLAFGERNKSVGAFTGHLANHFDAVDSAEIGKDLLPQVDISSVPNEKLAEFDSFLNCKIISAKNESLGISLKMDQKVDFLELYAESTPPPIETNIAIPSFQRNVSSAVPYQQNTQYAPNLPTLPSTRACGVKRLGGFRPPAALPPPTSDTVESKEDEDEEYEPDPKIRAKKQWRKQYDAAKQRERERKYNTPKYRDDYEPKENAGPSAHFKPPGMQDPSHPPAEPNPAPRQLGNRPGFRPASKFVSPLIRKNDGDQPPQSNQQQQQGSIKHNFIKTALNDGIEQEPQDERLKNLDPAMIEMILSEIVDTGPRYEWADVAGLEVVKKNIMEVIVWPMLRPDLFKGIRGPPKGLLLFGPPGTGKTMIGKCIASQCNATFFSISASSLLSKWFGEAEKMVRTLFAVARTRQPAVIFIDEVDSMLCKRGQDDQECSRRIKTEFLVQLDGVTCGENERILMIGATNLPSELDEAARRRFGKRLYVALPCQAARVQMVKRTMQKLDNGQCELTEDDYNEIAERAEGYSGSDMTHLCREASLGPLRTISDISSVSLSEIRAINLNDFISAFKTIRPSVAPQDLVELEKWNSQYGTVSSD